MIERAAAAHRAALDSLSVGDQHVSPTPYIRTRQSWRLFAEWREARPDTCSCSPLWHPVLVAEQIGMLAAIARGPFVMQCGARLGRRTVRRYGRQHQDASSVFEEALDMSGACGR